MKYCMIQQNGVQEMQGPHAFSNLCDFLLIGECFFVIIKNIYI